MVEAIDLSVECSVEFEVQPALFVFVDGVVSFLPHRVNQPLDKEEELCHPPMWAFPREAGMRVVVSLLLGYPFLRPDSVRSSSKTYLELCSAEVGVVGGNGSVSKVVK